jgi:hypothetical protein
VGDIKLGEPFGLDPDVLASIDWTLSLKRVLSDARSDFIYAPHLNYVFAKAGDVLVETVKSELKAGKFTPGLPLTIEVPKSFRIRVAAPISRLGPSYSRPGSILMPKDRLLYQAIADQVAPTVDKKTNKSRSFSHRLASKESEHMFIPTRECWSELQKALRNIQKTKI